MFSLPAAGSQRVNLAVEYKGSEKPVCCAGCQAVAQTIIQHNLHAYYEHRDTSQLQDSPVLPEELNDLNLYDNPDLQKEFVRHEGADTELATLTVENITCGACGWLIERELLRLEGIQKRWLMLPAAECRLAGLPLS